MHVDGQGVALAAFAGAMRVPVDLSVAETVEQRIASTHDRVIEIANSPDPVYGLNTGLGGNLGHRLAPGEIADFQFQIIAGRAVACGDPLPPEIGRGALLARIISAANGFSGISPGIFGHLADIYRSGLAPLIPEFGSIGASDLTQNAHLGLAVCGHGDFWADGQVVEAGTAFQQKNLSPPVLMPKDGLAMINHSGVTVALSAQALTGASTALDMLKQAAAMSYEGYGANRQILSEEANTPRPAPGQMQAATWFRRALDGSTTAPRRVQEALSFRGVAPLFGAADDAIARATSIAEDELNGTSDSPIIQEDGTMQSTPNFLSPALALALEAVAQAMTLVASASVQRMQRLMDPDLSGLPKYLAPKGGASAGFIPSQKTAAALLAEIRQGASPAFVDPAPVSETVEDIAPMTPASARKLIRQLQPLELLAGLEAIVAAQAIDLRGRETCGSLASVLHPKLHAQIPFYDSDRSVGPDIPIAAAILRESVEA